MTESADKISAVISREVPTDATSDKYSVRSVWLSYQLVKVYYTRGHYKEVLAKLEELIKGMAEKHGFDITASDDSDQT